MLYDFLTSERTAILDYCKQESLKETGNTLATSDLFNDGWPIFYDQLTEVLKRNIPFNDINPSGGEQVVESSDQALSSHAARNQGMEYLRLGYSVSDVVHSYGAVCQGITRAANDKNLQISAAEFRQLNYSLDIAVAEAVTEYQRIQSESANLAEVKRLGFLAHELRNSLMSASIALEMIEGGTVGVHSATSTVLGRSLQRMKNLIDTSLTEVRLRIEPVAHLQCVKIFEILSEVEATATREAANRNITLHVEPSGLIEVNIDRQLMVSALANLVQNAIKFTKPGGTVTVRTKEKDPHVLIEVEDECGGLKGDIEDLFRPFTQRNADQTGLGLGLMISRRAVTLNEGTITVENMAGKGCKFIITLPK